MKKLIQKISSVALLFISVATLNAQNVGINATGAAPSGDAMLDIAATNKGLLVPRVNIANLATIAPITGGTTTSLLVYNTNATTGLGYYYWDGVAWVKFTTGGDDWKIIGNANATSGTHFLGTTNGQAVNFRTNNLTRFTIANGYQVYAENDGTAALPFYSRSTDNNTGMYFSAADQLSWSTGGAERLRLTNTQLGTTFNGTAAAPAYTFTTDLNMGMFRATTDQLAFSTGGTERVRIDNNGSVGIGTTTPFTSNIGGVNVGRLNVVYNATPAGAAMSEIVNTSNNGVALAVVGTSTTNGFNIMEVTSSTNNFNGFFLHTSATNNRVALSGATNSGNNRWGFYSGDELLALNYFTISDERLKKDISQINSAIDNIKLLNPVQYRFDNNTYPSFGDQNEISFGFLAGELKDIFPNIVAENSVYNPNDLPTKALTKIQGEPKFSSVNYIGLIPILTKGIQEQQTMIEIQNTKIEALEKMVLELKNK